MHYYNISENGIFIDYGCTRIVPIKAGLLIPANANCSDTEQEYKKDLHAFLNKWFGGVELVAGTDGTDINSFR